MGLHKLACLVLLGCVVIRAVDARREGWDISPKASIVSASGLKDNTHEQLGMDALKSLSADLKALINEDNLIQGIEYNDMPNADNTNTDTLSFLVKFALGSKGWSNKNEVARSHFGCNQMYHAMCPVATTGTEANDYIVFNNKQVRVLISNVMNNWWMLANARYEAFKKNAKAAPSDDNSDVPIGHILHVIQDSFAPGHTLRDSSGPDHCGKVVLFQGYTMQEGNEHHGAADHDPQGTRSDINVPRRKELYKCSEKFTAAVLKVWAECKKNYHETTQEKIWCLPGDMLKIVQNEAIVVSPDQGTSVAGGSVLFYSSLWHAKEAETKAKVDKAVEDKKIAVRTVKVAGAGAYADCTSKDGDDCNYDIVQPVYDMTRSVKDVPHGILFEEFAQEKRNQGRTVISVCGGQLNVDEEKATENHEENYSRFHKVRKLKSAVDAMSKKTQTPKAQTPKK